MLVRLLPVTTLLALSSCTTYFEDAADPAELAARIRERPGGRFTFAAAVTAAFAQNAELQALAARARAAGAVTTPLEVQAEWRSEQRTLAVMLDPIALLGLGPRGGEIDVVDAEAAAAVQALATARWRVAAAIAEAFAVHEALAPLEVLDIPIDAAAFERAGLAGPVAAAQVRAAQARAAAEALELANARAGNLATLRELLGLHRDTQLEPESSPDDAVQQPASGDAALLQRPDLALVAARFHTADAEFRRAVADQYPSLMIGPEFALGGGPLAAMAVLRLPIGAHGRASAARDRREAARADLAAAYLAASREAHQAELELATAAAQSAAAAAGQSASTTALRSALVAAAVEIDAFDRVAETAGMAVRETMERRVASVVEARARVRAAVAGGWPTAQAAPPPVAQPMAQPVAQPVATESR